MSWWVWVAWAGVAVLVYCVGFATVFALQVRTCLYAEEGHRYVCGYSGVKECDHWSGNGWPWSWPLWVPLGLAALLVCAPFAGPWLGTRWVCQRFESRLVEKHRAQALAAGGGED